MRNTQHYKVRFYNSTDQDQIIIYTKLWINNKQYLTVIVCVRDLVFAVFGVNKETAQSSPVYIYTYGQIHMARLARVKPVLETARGAALYSHECLFNNHRIVFRIRPVCVFVCIRKLLRLCTILIKSSYCLNG